MKQKAIAREMGHVDKNGNPRPATTLRHYQRFLRSVDESNLAKMDAFATTSLRGGLKSDGLTEERQQS